MKHDIFLSVDSLEPFVKISDDEYRWITLGVDGVVRIASSGPVAATIRKQLLEAPPWATGGVACRRIGDIDLQTKEYTLEEGETLGT